MRLHPASLLVGAALMVGVGLLSAQQIVGSPAVDVRVRNPIEVRGIADPRDIVRIHQNQPYTVPTGKILVITAHGTVDSFKSSDLRIDGVEESHVREQGGSGGQNGVLPAIAPLPAPGVTAQAGQVVEITSGTTDAGRAWGYLVNQ